MKPMTVKMKECCPQLGTLGQAPLPPEVAYPNGQAACPRCDWLADGIPLKLRSRYSAPGLAIILPNIKTESERDRERERERERERGRERERERERAETKNNENPTKTNIMFHSFSGISIIICFGCFLASKRSFVDV